MDLHRRAFSVEEAEDVDLGQFTKDEIVEVSK